MIAIFLTYPKMFYTAYYVDSTFSEVFRYFDNLIFFGVFRHITRSDERTACFSNNEGITSFNLL